MSEKIETNQTNVVNSEFERLEIISDDDLKKKLKSLEVETNSLKSDVKRFQSEQSKNNGFENKENINQK